MMRKRKPKKRDTHEIAIAAALLTSALMDEEFCHELATQIAAIGNAFNQSLFAVSGKEQKWLALHICEMTPASEGDA